ncbi:MAG: NCS2 family permease, partial [Pseudomonadota bacterium]
LLLNLLDASGTLMAVGQRAGLMEKCKLKNARKALVTDAGGTMIGAALGTSPVTAYIESAAGVGGKTGLVAVTVAGLFALALLLAPLAGAVPAYATAPALIFVAALFARELKEIEWDDITESLPALVTALAIPFTFSIAEGIGMGFITYAGIKLLTGRAREIGPGVAIIALAFGAKLALT